MTTAVFRLYDLPWTPDPAAETRFRRITSRLGLAVLALCLLVPWLPLPEQPAVAPVPERYARLVLEREVPPPPEAEEPPAAAVRQPIPETEIPPEPALQPEPPKAVPAAPAVPPAKLAEPSPGTAARQQAASTGVMQFAASLAGLRESSALGAVTGNDDLVSGTGETETEQRNLVTARSGRSSAGVRDSDLSTGTGGRGIGGRAVSAVNSPMAAGSAVSGGRGEAGTGGGSGNTGLATRSREEIELVFDRNKSALYALYSRALRRAPGLSGKLVLELTIAPDGTVTACRVLESQLGDPDFERKVVARVKMFRFEARQVAEVTASKPLDFFPSSG